MPEISSIEISSILMAAIRGPDLNQLTKAKLVITGPIRQYVAETYHASLEWLIVIRLGAAQPSEIQDAMEEIRRVLVWSLDVQREVRDGTFIDDGLLLGDMIASAVTHWAAHCSVAAESIAASATRNELLSAQWYSLTRTCDEIFSAARVASEWDVLRPEICYERMIEILQGKLDYAGGCLYRAHGIEEEYCPL